MKTTKKKSLALKFSKGSAFIFVVLLTTLLAVIGLMFLMTARFDRFSTTSIIQDRDLDNAARTIVANISQQLVLDTPGIDPNQEYYDYPDPNTDPWLANLEPYKGTDGNYYWRHISDVTGYLARMDYSTLNVPVDPPGQGVYIEEYPKTGNLTRDFGVFPNGHVMKRWADADGDGIADSMWIQLADVNTSSGKPVYAAIRVVDDGGKLNVITSNKFTPFGYDVNSNEVDGSSQLQINLIELAKRSTKNANPDNTLNTYRNPSNKSRSEYEANVIWNYNVPPSSFTPFDISDELELRYRYLINHSDNDTRSEIMWDNCFQISNTTPYDGSDAGSNISAWKAAADYNLANPLGYDYRHLATTYNMDRIINPFGGRMINIQNIPLNVPADWAQTVLYDQTLLPCAIDDLQRAQFAQAAANMKDYADFDTVVTTVLDPFGVPHYGYERPDIYISEIAVGYTYIGVRDPNSSAVLNADSNDPNLHRSYAIEIYNKFQCACDDFNDWRIIIERDGLLISEIPITLNEFQTRGGQYYVAIFEDELAPLKDRVEWSDSPPDGAAGVDPNVTLWWPDIWGRDANGVWVQANAYDVYFGTSLNDVRDANSSWPVGGVYKGRQFSNMFNPGKVLTNTTYYWRIAGVNTIDDTIIDEGQPPWSFTTWDTEPDSVWEPIDPCDPNFRPILTPDTFIRLERRVPGKLSNNGFLIVDLLGPAGAPDDRIMPPWLFDFNDADFTLKTRSFQRDLSDQGRLRRLWNLAVLPDCVLTGDFSTPRLPITLDTLGHHNDFVWPDALFPLQSHQRRLNNVGELGFIFKKSTYYEGTCADRIQIRDTEADNPGIGIKLDVANPGVQNMFKFLTVMDPLDHPVPLKDPNETRVQGRININTAPWYVLAQLPWVSIRENNIQIPSLAQSIVAYRDRLDLSSMGGPKYDTRSGHPGFDNIGQLNYVNLSVPDMFSSLWYYALDGKDQQGYPDLTVDRRLKIDGYPNDLEERDLIFARISDLVTVRSDVFTAYILVRLGPNGPQRRFIAILDRSQVHSPADKVIVRALYPVPDPR